MNISRRGSRLALEFLLLGALFSPASPAGAANETADEDWFSAVVNHMGKEKGLQYFRKLSANGLSVRTGHTLIAQLIAAGE